MNIQSTFNQTIIKNCKMKSISNYMAQFKASKNPFYLGKAVFLLLAEKRMNELLYGYYCQICYKPSIVSNITFTVPKAILNKEQLWLSNKIFSRDELIDIFIHKFNMYSLPDDFSGSRLESIVYYDNILIIGEYGISKKRIIYATETLFKIHNYYTNNSNVTHIHAIYKDKLSRQIFITTGDTAKLLDIWYIKDSTLVLQEKKKKKLAGYTAITKIQDNYYFGTDFSSRPNYIERNDGKKFFFPSKAYNMYVIAFYKHLERYIISINVGIRILGGTTSISIFDTISEKFILCDFIDLTEGISNNNNSYTNKQICDYISKRCV